MFYQLNSVSVYATFTFSSLPCTDWTSPSVCTCSQCRQGCLKRGCFGPGMIVRTVVRFTSANLLVQKWASLNGLASVRLFGGELASLKLVVSVVSSITAPKHVLNMLWVTVGGLVAQEPAVVFPWCNHSNKSWLLLITTWGQRSTIFSGLSIELPE